MQNACLSIFLLEFKFDCLHCLSEHAEQQSRCCFACVSTSGQPCGDIAAAESETAEIARGKNPTLEDATPYALPPTGQILHHKPKRFTPKRAPPPSRNTGTGTRLLKSLPTVLAACGTTPATAGQRDRVAVVAGRYLSDDGDRQHSTARSRVPASMQT